MASARTNLELVSRLWLIIMFLDRSHGKRIQKWHPRSFLIDHRIIRLQICAGFSRLLILRWRNDELVASELSVRYWISWKTFFYSKERARASSFFLQILAGERRGQEKTHGEDIISRRRSDVFTTFGVESRISINVATLSFAFTKANIQAIKSGASHRATTVLI